MKFLMTWDMHISRKTFLLVREGNFVGTGGTTETEADVEQSAEIPVVREGIEEPVKKKIKKKPDKPDKPDKPPKRQGGTYPVFVRPPREGKNSKHNPKLQEQREQADDAGIKYVKTFEQQNGRVPHVKPHNNPGYDILSQNQKEIRYIEVKSLTHNWSESGVALSKTQFEFGKEKGDEYWLYVVEGTGDGEPVLHCIQNPVELANKFHFDPSWSILSEGHST